MPMRVNLASEAALSTIVTDEFLASVKRNIGFDPETPMELLPVDLNELLAECISICEKEQWRFILRKEVSLSLPYEAFCWYDRLVFLPFGEVNSITTFTYIKDDLTTGTVSADKYTLYPHEPSKLWCSDWSDVFRRINTEQPYPITLTYTTGYASYGLIPRSTVRALKILAYHLFEYRDAISEGHGTISELPQGYCQLRDLSLLNDHRAIRYIVDDWKKVSRG